MFISLLIKLSKFFIKKIIFIVFLCNILNAQEKNYFTSNGNYQSHKNSDLININEENINNLEVIWTYKNIYKQTNDPNKKSQSTSRDDPTSNNQLTPIFTGKSIIFSTFDNNLVSINPTTGDEIWKKKILSSKNIAKRGLTFYKIKINETNYKNIIFTPTNSGVFAIQEEDGEIYKKIGNQGKFGNSNSALSPIIVKNNIFIANSDSVESYELNNNKKNWKLDLINTRIWSGFSYDEVNKVLIIVTSNPAYPIYSNLQTPDLSSSIIVIDTKTGKIKCSYQDVKNDQWDLDMVSSPIVINNSKIETTAFGFSKTGNVIAINLNTCKRAFKNSYIKIKTPKSDETVKGAKYSLYQKKIIIPEQLSEIKYDYLKYLKTINNKDEKDYLNHKTRYSKYNEDFIPLSLNYDVTLMGLHGGPQWPGGSFDKINNQIIIPTNHDPWIIRLYYEDKILKIKRGLNARLKRFINNDEILSNYKILKNLEIDSSNNIDKLYFNISKIFHFSGAQVYQNKCQSCHSNRQANIESEFTGNYYLPSLTNISSSPKFNSLKNKENFNYAHKYVHADISVSSSELEMVAKYFYNFDNFLKKTNLISLAYRWQILLDKNKLPASIPPWVKITAFDVSTGKINWSIPSGITKKNDYEIKGSSNFGGVLSTNSNIFFMTGTSDEKIYAYNSRTGKEIWSYNLPFSGSAPPMTYLLDKEQYILVNSSGGRFYNYKKSDGDYLIAFKLKK
jgi:quinoprotein glucose dehydrogenase